METEQLKTWGRYAIGGVSILALVLLVAATLWASYYFVMRSISGTQQTIAPGEEVIIGLDLSSGSPLVTNTEFALKAGRRVGEGLTELPMRSMVHLRSFSSYNVASDQLFQDWEISRNSRPQTVSRMVSTVVQNIPKLIENDRLKVFPETNILAFLDSMAPHLDCKNRKTTVVLVTDGIEDSELAKLGDMTGSLPAPAKKLFEECERLTMLGIGRPAEGGSAELTQFLHKEWEAWANKAGFKSFSGVRDW